MNAEPTGALLTASNLVVEFKQRTRQGHPLRAVDDVSFDVSPRTTLAIVGESGSGKTTLARAVIGLQQLSSGSVRYLGHPLLPIGKRKMKNLRNIQMIFQDPHGSLNPRMSIGAALQEPLMIHTSDSSQARKRRVQHALDEVGLPSTYISRYPHELSGGECQRVCIARAMILRPALLICDEPTSALDVLTQAQVIDLLKSLQARHGSAYIFISHNLGVVESLSHEVAVMHKGRIVEHRNADVLFSDPQHTYTKRLLDAVCGAQS